MGGGGLVSEGVRRWGGGEEGAGSGVCRGGLELHVIWVAVEFL